MKLRSLDEAIDLVSDGASLGVGGVLLKRKPMRFLAGLVTTGRRHLTAVTFLGSLDIELLASAEAISSFSGGYVGFEQLGFAPRFREAVEAGDVRYDEYSEFLFVSGLRAAAAGLPFFPTKGASGSDLANELGIREIADPYTGVPVLAVPALSPDVAVIHAEVADREGNVGTSSAVDFLSDFDVNIARASRNVIVTTERVVDALDGPAALFAHEVTCVVELVDGARPTSLPGAYPADLGSIQAYLEAPSIDSLLAMVP